MLRATKRKREPTNAAGTQLRWATQWAHNDAVDKGVMVQGFKPGGLEGVRLQREIEGLGAKVTTIIKGPTTSIFK